jgi:hypothetical protein
MKTTLRSVSFLMFFAAAVALLLGAATPEPVTAGKFLVLRNGHTLRGDIERVGDQYRVRRDGGETWIAAGLVARLFRDTEEAYQFLRAKADLKDADERLQLAQWCLDMNLGERALEEATAADLLRPHHAQTQHLLARLREPQAAPPTGPPMPPPQVEPPPEPPAPAPDLPAAVVGQFANKVEPILLNACASCHAAGRGGSFKLMRAGDVAALKRKATQENLVAVLGQVNQVQPQASPLLTKAVSVHGGGDKAPLSGRQLVAFHALEEWVRGTVTTSPQLPDKVVVPPVPETKPTFAGEKPDAPRSQGEPPRPNTVPISPAQPSAPPPPASTSAPSGDAFDPAEFNRLAHPERDKAPTPKP